MKRLSGKTVVITGATAGIGAATATSVASQGGTPILLGRRKERLESMATAIQHAHGMSAPFYVLDVTDRSGIAGFVRWLDDRGLAVDALVNNAGLGRGLKPIHEGDHDDWDDMIETNIKGVLNMTRALLPAMVTRDAGHIVNIGSIAGRTVYPNGNVYNATKFAVRALTQATNIDLVGTRVRVSSVDPGLVETEFSDVRLRGRDPARAAATYQSFTTLQPEDIADAVCYVLGTPDHVNILEMLVMPTDQRSPYVAERASRPSTG